MAHIDSVFVEIASSRGQRFTGRGRLAFRYAEQEAERRAHAGVVPAHLMLGVLRDQDSVAVVALRSLGVATDALVGAVEELLRLAPSDSTEEVSPELRAAVEAALDEAGGLGHDHVGTEHLLLGLLREPAFASALEAAGTALEGVRSEVLRALEGWRHGPGGAVCAATA